MWLIIKAHIFLMKQFASNFSGHKNLHSSFWLTMFWSSHYILVDARILTLAQFWSSETFFKDVRAFYGIVDCQTKIVSGTAQRNKSVK